MAIDLLTDAERRPATHGVSLFETLFGFIPDDSLLSEYDKAHLYMERPCPKLHFRAEGTRWRVETRIRLDFDLDTLVGTMRCIVSTSFHSASGDHADPANLAAYIKAVQAAEALSRKVTASRDRQWSYAEAEEAADDWLRMQGSRIGTGTVRGVFQEAK